MKKFVILIVLFCGIVSAQSGKTTLSAYYTHGLYSDVRESSSLSAFGKVNLNYHDYIIASFENLNINFEDSWTYNQKVLLLGGYKNFYPFFLKINGAFINGEFEDELYNGYYNYSDNSFLLNADLKWNYNLFFLGASATYINFENGFNPKVKGTQLGLSLGYYITPEIYISLSPYRTSLSGRDDLYSVLTNLYYTVSDAITLSAGVSLGERAYFFNPDFLTLFNQDETQNFWYRFGCDYSISKNISLNAFYQFSNFKEVGIIPEYQIQYFGGGISFSF